MNTNAILIGPCKSRIPIDGSLSNAFEYFYFAWLHNKNIILIIDTTFESLTIVKKYLEIKYNINKDCFKNIIIFKKSFVNVNNLILFEMYCIDHFDRYKPFLKCKNLYALSGSKNHTLECNYFVEYEHLKPVGKSVNYRSKIFFEILNKPRFQKNQKFINTRAKYIKKESEITRNDLNIMSNIFEQFNEMLYIQDPVFFDVKPRLFQECQYFGIPYEFIEHKDCFDGANLRAFDYDLESRAMGLEDPIISLLVDSNNTDNSSSASNSSNVNNTRS
ncbi:hypothetical phage protein [Campylobacter phage CP220]|uniref:Hypothetical phage protein n=1 Tax=Campylobacter phage CP220 TaxID=2994044 RepID=D5GV69_9CAUD|nr:hypothetical protein APL47_gp077 [Campylobacter phage CP220]CBJ93886.1 hypothetical phage protein [Campylobacter phage CP220]